MSLHHLPVKIINKSHHPLPAYETPGAAGMDVRAYLPEGPVTVGPGERALIPTGLYMQLPQGYECQIRPRSGLALNYGITIANSPGTVDCDYRGEIGIILLNTSKYDFTVNDGERICQMVITEYTAVKWEEVEELDRTKREDGSFGHSGVN
ncbi:MAG: dUTP diphosphatase [Bacteroides sp.]|nr:dUTP diphosphatase [Bacteroides sp.]MBD5337389.1 dUTP diphosphatase [Bacteroides sp.]